MVSCLLFLEQPANPFCSFVRAAVYWNRGVQGRLLRAVRHGSELLRALATAKATTGNLTADEIRYLIDFLNAQSNIHSREALAERELATWLEVTLKTTTAEAITS